MRSLQLPSEKETTLELLVEDKKIVVDILDIEVLHYEAASTRDKMNPDDDIYSYFIDMFFRKYDTKLSKKAASMLLTAKNEINAELKKKYTPSSDQEDTSDSDQETNENSISSDS